LINSIVSKWWYLQLGKQIKLTGSQFRQVGWVGDKSHVVFGQEFADKTGSVRQCVVLMYQPVLVSPKLGAKSLHILN
jgi:hypothetical protein